MNASSMLLIRIRRIDLEEGQAAARGAAIVLEFFTRAEVCRYNDFRAKSGLL